MICHKPHPKPRRLIVDTDLGLDDLVALAILRVQQFLSGSSGGGDGDHKYHQHHNEPRCHLHRPPSFHIAGVTLTSGISVANTKNSELLRRILPPGTPVYVSSGGNHFTTDTSSSSLSSTSSYSSSSQESTNNNNKPIWWTRTANRVGSFLSSLPHHISHTPPVPLAHKENNTIISAEQFIASNMDDANVDFLCLAPLSTVTRALRLRSSSSSTTASSAPKASFYIMGGIQSDSRVTKRGESTSPFGYNDPITTQNGWDAHQAMSNDSSSDNFGEFNFALDIDAARTVLSAIPDVRLIPLESCTLVPTSLGSNTDADSCKAMLSLSSVLNDTPPCDSETTSELQVARNNLRKLLHEFGTTETQWDSIAAAIYCNAFYNNDHATDSVDSVTTKIGLCKRLDSRAMELSDLGEITFPTTGQIVDDEAAPPATLWIYPDFTLDDEINFVRFLSVLLHS